MINERRYGASKGKKDGEDCQYEESGRFMVLPPYRAKPAWSGVDNLHLALQFPLPGAESLALCLMQPFDATTTDF